MKEKILQVMKDYNEELVEDLDRDLIATGILDSFDLVKLVVELEDAFDIEIDVQEVIPDHFQTANRIVQLVESRISAVI